MCSRQQRDGRGFSGPLRMGSTVHPPGGAGPGVGASRVVADLVWWMRSVRPAVVLESGISYRGPSAEYSIVKRVRELSGRCRGSCVAAGVSKSSFVSWGAVALAASLVRRVGRDAHLDHRAACRLLGGVSLSGERVRIIPEGPVTCGRGVGW